MIEDFPCPPLSLSVALGRFKTRIIRYAARVEDADKSNCLMAYDLGPGKLKWILDAATIEKNQDTYHPDTHFLAPPLPL